LDDEVEVGLPAIAKPVVGIAFDLPSPRVTGGAGVTASNTHVDVLDSGVTQTVVWR